MKKSTNILVILFFILTLPAGWAQDSENAKTKIEALQSKKASITNAEREALKIKVESLNKQLAKGLITQDVANQQKKEVAEQHAANIDDRIAIIDRNIALLLRNEGLVPGDLISKEKRFVVGLGHEYNDRYIGIFFRRKKPKIFKYDKRLSSGLVLSIGLNNAFRDGESLGENGFSVNADFYELGWAWHYRVLKHSNALRLNFGALYQHNKYEFVDGYYDVNDEERVQFYQDDSEDKYGKLVSENFVLQFHLETGSSKVRETEKSIRYSIRKQFRFGLGGFVGVPIELWQTLDYDPDDPEIIESELNSLDEVRIYKETEYDFRTNNLVYGVSAYAGVGSFLLYVKYDLSSTFRNAVVEQNNISLGLRVDM